jgi:regulatory protein
VALGSGPRWSAGGGAGRPNRRRDTDGPPPALDDSDGDVPADPESVARTICLNQLTHGPRTRSQLADTLRKRLVPDDAAEAVLDRLTEVGLIDDAAYAAGWVHSRRASRGLSSSAIARELRDRGVEPHLVADAMVDVGPDEDEASARDLARRRLRSMSGLPAQTQVRRLVGYLGRKGYSPGLAYRVVREELDVAVGEL